MTVKQAITGLLEDDAGVGAIVGAGTVARIYQAPAPHGVSSPFLTYQIIDIAGSGYSFDDGKPAFEEVSLQIDCWAEAETTPSADVQADGLAAAVRVALDNKGVVASGVEIARIYVTGGPRDLSEEGWRRRQLDFSIWTKGV